VNNREYFWVLSERHSRNPAKNSLERKDLTEMLNGKGGRGILTSEEKLL